MYNRKARLAATPLASPPYRTHVQVSRSTKHRCVHAEVVQHSCVNKFFMAPSKASAAATTARKPHVFGMSRARVLHYDYQGSSESRFEKFLGTSWEKRNVLRNVPEKGAAEGVWPGDQVGRAPDACCVMTAWAHFGNDLVWTEQRSVTPTALSI